MIKKVGSWIGSAKRYVSNLQNEVSSIGEETKKTYKENNNKTEENSIIDKKKDD